MNFSRIPVRFEVDKKSSYHLVQGRVFFLFRTQLAEQKKEPKKHMFRAIQGQARQGKPRQSKSCITENSQNKNQIPHQNLRQINIQGSVEEKNIV